MANEEHLAWLKQGAINILDRSYKAVASGATYIYAWARTWITEWQAGEAIRRTRQRAVVHLHSIPWPEIARQYLPLLVGIGVPLLLFTLWKLPQWYAASWNKLIDPKDVAQLESDTRATLVQSVGGLFVLMGLFFTAKTWRTTQEGQITDRFSKAIEHLGSDKLDVHLGGIFALERIARDSKKDYWTIMEVLTAFIRQKSPRKEEESRQSSYQEQNTYKCIEPPKLRADVQAALTVLGRRQKSYKQGEELRLDLSDTDLRKAHLARTHLEGAILIGADLEEATLVEAHLEGAHLTGANLKGAVLFGTHLEEADLSTAHLELAHFGEEPVKGKHDKTHLEGADLTNAYGLEKSMIASAIIDDKTLLPKDCEHPWIRE